MHACTGTAACSRAHTRARAHTERNVIFLKKNIGSFSFMAHSYDPSAQKPAAEELDELGHLGLFVTIQ